MPSLLEKEVGHKHKLYSFPHKHYMIVLSCHIKFWRLCNSNKIFCEERSVRAKIVIFACSKKYVYLEFVLSLSNALAQLQKYENLLTYVFHATSNKCDRYIALLGYKVELLGIGGV